MIIEFKIDTKDNFSTITPLSGQIDAILTGALKDKCEDVGQSGSGNFIVDFHHCQEIDKEAIVELIALNEEIYGGEHSIVFTGINNKIMATLKHGEVDLLLNIARKMEEAIDIISMEILERDLLGEE